MSEILESLSSRSVVRAIEANTFELAAVGSQWPRLETHFSPDLIWGITDIPIASFNGVLLARLPADEVERTIKHILSRATARRVPMLWSVGPATRPKDMGDHLQAHGFTYIADSPGLALDLTLPAEKRRAPAGLTIAEIKIDEPLSEWIQVFAEGFSMADQAAEAFLESFSFSRAVGGRSLRYYLGRMEGKAVAVSTMFLGAGVAGIYNVATLPEARRQGIGAQMTMQPLLEARELGYRVATLISSELGLGVYRRLGFREQCQISIYLWDGESANDAG